MKRSSKFVYYPSLFVVIIFREIYRAPFKREEGQAEASLIRFIQKTLEERDGINGQVLTDFNSRRSGRLRENARNGKLPSRAKINIIAF